jgi:hypothetical protein
MLMYIRICIHIYTSANLATTIPKHLAQPYLLTHIYRHISTHMYMNKTIHNHVHVYVYKYIYRYKHTSANLATTMPKHLAHAYIYTIHI